SQRHKNESLSSPATSVTARGRTGIQLNGASRKTFWIPAFAGMTVFLLSACTAHQPSRVPVTIMGTESFGTVDRMAARAGDTPERLAKKTNLDIASLIEMNGLVPGQHLTPGQKLNVPIPQEITVIEGDTVDSIARAFGLDRNALIAENNLKKPIILYRGQKLRIPQSQQQPDDSAAPIVADAYDSRFAVDDLAPVADGNATSPITTTDTGSGSKIHSSASGTIVEEDLAPPPSSSSAVPATSAMETAMLTPPATLQATEPMALTTPEPKPEPMKFTGATPKFSWPVNGSTLSGFGPKSGGRHNDGINIGAPVGTSVRAAAPGEVVYVGDNVAGFGNLILVKHDGGFATAYAHVQNPTVKRGDRVDPGQAIAQVGKTGNVTSPQLHFEVRKGTQAVNPMTYLP